MASDPQANQITMFLPLAEGFDLHEVAFDLPYDITGISERDSVNFRGSFARRVNTIPMSGEVWTSSGNYLWDIYREVLEGPVQLATFPVSVDEESRIKTARDMIGPPDNPTPKYKTYMNYKNRYRALEDNLQKAKEKLINTTDSELKELIQSEIDRYQKELEDVKQEWMAVGYKIEIEEALHKLSESHALRPFIRWTSWQNDLNPLNQEADGYGAFWPTGYRPEYLFDKDTDWTKLTLSKSEIDSLENNAPPELVRFRDILGDRVRVQGEIEQVSMEMARVDVERSWFHPELLTSRFWKWKFQEEEPLSNGAEPWPKGRLPGYIIGLVLVRNINITIKQPQPGSGRNPGGSSGGGGGGGGGGPSCYPQHCMMVPDNILILGNLVLKLNEVHEEEETLSVQPLRGELLRVDSNHIPTDDSLTELLSASGHTIRRSSIGGNALLLAYIVQKSPKSPNPDSALNW